MNDLDMNTLDPDRLQDIASIDLKQLLAAGLPRKTLFPLVKGRVKLAIAQFIQRAPISTSTSDAVSPAELAAYLRGVRAIPLPLELCTLMTRVGFDKALFTYGHVEGMPTGYAEGLWLLEFVERTEKEPARHQEPSWLGFLGMVDAGMRFS